MEQQNELKQHQGLLQRAHAELIDKLEAPLRYIRGSKARFNRRVDVFRNPRESQFRQENSEQKTIGNGTQEVKEISDESYEA